MDGKKGEARGLNILCIDGGGLRGLSSLLLISEIMKRLDGLPENDTSLNPVDCFDLIAGTGTGGVSACMLGRLGMSIDQAIRAHMRLIEEVSSHKKLISTSGSSEYKGTKLREALQSMVRDVSGNQDERMKEEQVDKDQCKTMVFAMSKRNMNASIPVLFRSYDTTTSPAPDCTIWEAAYASMAHPDLFKGIEISDGQIRHSFVGGELGCSNPVSHVLAEVKNLYPDRHVSSILSIGAGHTRTIHIPDPSPSQRFLHTEAVLAMKDMATDSERVASEMATRFQNTTGVYYRLNVDQGMQYVEGDCENLSQVAAHTRTYISKVETSRMLTQAARAIKDKKPTISITYIDGSIRAPSITVKRCPAPTSVFTGRNDHVREVGNCIFGGSDERRVCVVHGLGGAGKTQVALKAIELNRDSWTHVLYVDASSKQAIEGALQDFARAKEIGKTHNDTLVWLEFCRDPWLIVFDNADHPSLNIHEYFPSGNRGSVLITTRLPDLAAHGRGPGSVCHISDMSQEDGLALLLRVARVPSQTISERELEAASLLLKDFGYLALAIVHAGAYIGHSSHLSIARYRELFRDQRQRTLEQYNTLKVKLDGYDKSIYTTWRMCYDLLEAGGKAQQMFWLLAYFHHEGISEEMFRRAATNILSYEPKLQQTEIEQEACSYMRRYLQAAFLSSDGCWDTLQFSNVISELTSYSLIGFDRVNLTYGIHVLVQDWVRTVIPQTRDFALECTTTLLSQSIDWEDTAESLIFRRNLCLHVDKVLQERRGGIGSNHAAGYAAVYGENGRWAQKENLEILLKETTEKELGEEHPDTLSSMNNLASTYWNQGRWNDAESLQVQVLNAHKRVLGEEHPDTLRSMNNLASTYSNQGRWNEAESLQVQVLNAHKRVLGEEHPDTLSSMNNLAFTYSNQGRWNDAKSLQVQVLNARKRALGEEHPDTLSSMSNLASTYWNQGRWNDAESLQVQVLNARKRVLGEEHPDTLSSMNNLASTYRHQGQWDEVELLLTQVSITRIRVLGQDHPDTLNTLKTLASAYSIHHPREEAEALLIKIAEISNEQIGDQHPSTLRARKALEAVQSNRASTKNDVGASLSYRLMGRLVPLLRGLVAVFISFMSPLYLTLFFLFLPAIVALLAYIYFSY